jgi:hypothetical protein
MSISQQTLGYKDTLFKVAVDLPDVLEIDPKKMVVRVEPSVTIGLISSFNMVHSLKTILVRSGQKKLLVVILLVSNLERKNGIIRCTKMNRDTVKGCEAEFRK